MSNDFRRFRLIRLEDVTGISGTGLVAEGCQFSDGTAVVRWLTPRPSTVFWSSMEDVKAINGHGGKTQIEWLTPPASERSRDE